MRVRNLTKLSIVLMTMIQFTFSNVNWCSKSRCGNCVRVEAFHSCLECANSVSVLATVESGENVYKCEGNDTGLDNCMIKYSEEDLPLEGCKVCNNEYYQDYDTDVNIKKCTEGNILNCAVYADNTGSGMETCLAC